MTSFSFGIGTKIIAVGNGSDRTFVTAKNKDQSPVRLNILLEDPFIVQEIELGPDEQDLLHNMCDHYHPEISIMRICELFCCAKLSEHLTIFDERRYKPRRSNPFPIEDLGEGSMLSGVPRIGPSKVIFKESKRSRRRFQSVYCHRLSDGYAYLFLVSINGLKNRDLPCNEAIVSYVTREENVIYPN